MILNRSSNSLGRRQSQHHSETSSPDLTNIFLEATKWVAVERSHIPNTSGRLPVAGTVNHTTGKPTLRLAALSYLGLQAYYGG